jgi:sugar phosphate isomerase/epimerase
VAEVEAGLDRYTTAIKASFGQPLAAGLWLAKPVVRELLETPDALSRFADGLQGRGLSCHTLNAFPFGNFHSARVKENVYLPDWTAADRYDYTMQCALILGRLLPEGGEGSISTVPLGFKGFAHSSDFLRESAARLIDAAVTLARYHEQTGKMIRLAIEPEPLCVLETIAEAISFFDLLALDAARAGKEQAVRAHIGLCYDVCHQAVEFEDAGESIRALDEADIRINKLHISCALQLDNPAENNVGRAALRRYVEPRYLHQTTALNLDGSVIRQVDLTEEFIRNPPGNFADARAWRIHFHVPVNAHHMGPLSTTRPDLLKAVAAIAELDYAPHLEVETYTWEVLPDAKPGDLVDGLTRELLSAAKIISEAGNI